MAYIEIHDTITDHPKTKRLMGRLAIGKVATVGHLVCLFTWAIRFRPGGILEADVVEGAAEWTGKPGDLLKALMAEHLHKLSGGKVEIHDWPDYTRGYRKAKKDAERRHPSATAARGKRVKSARQAVNRTEQTRTERSRAEGGAPARPAASPLPPVPPELKGLKLYEVDANLLKKWPELYPIWKTTFPNIDHVAEIRKAHAWELTNSKKIDRPDYFRRWFTKAQDQLGRQSQSGARPPAPVRVNQDPRTDATKSCKTCSATGMILKERPHPDGGNRKETWAEPCPDCRPKSKEASA